MTKLTIRMAVMLCLAAPVGAWAQGTRTYETITVANASIGLATATYRPSGLPQMQECLARLETAEIRWRLDGTDPTSAEGIVMEPGDVLPIKGNTDMARIRFIRTTATSGVLKVQCSDLVTGQPFAPGSTTTVTPGGGAANLGKAEDAPAASGDTGVAVLGVRKDTATQTTNADGDYTIPAIDAYSATYVRQDHPNRAYCTSGSPLAVSTATTLKLLNGCAAPGATLSIYITDVSFSTSASGIAADSFPTLKYGTGGACGTGTTVIWGAFTPAAAQAVVVQTFATPIKIPANNEVCFINSTAGSKMVAINVFIAP